jgi:Major tropism determinant N-terminal domain
MERSELSVQVQLRRDTAANISAFTPAQGEGIVDLTNNRLTIGDGSTSGGHPMARLSEVVLNDAASNVLALGPNGSSITLNVVEQELLSLSGASVNASTQIPAGALLFAVATRVVTAITGATSFSVGYSGSLSAFGSGLGIAAGSTNEGLIGPNPFYSATTVVLTAAGGAFTAGAVRLSLMYLMFGPPTS